MADWSKLGVVLIRRKHLIISLYNLNKRYQLIKPHATYFKTLRLK